MPIILNEPLSFLQRVAEYMEYSELLDQAVGEKDPIKRMELVSAFAVSSMSSNAGRVGKPFNPLLGETYELHYRNFVFVAEQVSHHPPITAFHVESDNYSLRATLQFKLRFWGKSIDVQPKGLVTLQLYHFNESYTWQNVNLTIHNILTGKIWVEHTGTLRITNHSLGLYCQLEFHPSNSFGHGCNRVVGELYAPSTLDKTQAVSASNTSHNTTIDTISKNIFNHHNNSYVLKRIIFGNWSRGLFTVEPNVWNEKEEIIDNQPKKNSNNNDNNDADGQSTNSSECIESMDYGFEIPLTGQRCLWIATPKPINSKDYYDFTQYTMGLNELTICKSTMSNDNITDNQKNSSVIMSNCTNNIRENQPKKNSNNNDNNDADGQSTNSSECIESMDYGFEIPLTGQRCLWIATPKPINSKDYYDFTQYTMGLNELTIYKAASEKLRLEEKQRYKRKSLNGQRKISNFNWPISTNHKSTGKQLNLTDMNSPTVNNTAKQFFTNNPFKKAFSSNSTGHRSTLADDNDNDKNSCNYCTTTTTTTSDISSNNSYNQIISPLWFIPSVNPFTKQEEWRMTGDYWKRDWSKCPDLY
ncbi:oxysterol-binding protein-related protein 1/2 [Schistosoma bovis]|uniref:Oxysterol-binding protein n=1 Tax=Schistosoma bovis TaxID=6184 RepID=A0A430QG13_SCHBO|nr:oxysterol-binding protein-related protein 1/2 [Schistosoma bovis]